MGDVSASDWERGEHHHHYGAAIPREHYRMMPEISVKRGGIQFNVHSPAVTGSSRMYVGDAEDSLLGLTPILGGKQMRNDQEILTQAEELRAEADRLEKIVAEREKYGDDPFKNGSVLKVDMRYRTGSRRSFAYAVIKVGGKFYLTGKLVNARTSGSDTASGFTWEQFVAWLSQGDATVWQAGSLKQIF